MTDFKFYTDYPDTSVPDNAETANDNITAFLEILGLDVDTYDNTETYAIDDFVVKDYKLWRCTTAITTPESWNSTKWIEDSILVSE